MEHELLQVDCTEMSVGNACTQSSCNDKKLSRVFILISLCSSLSQIEPFNHVTFPM